VTGAEAGGDGEEVRVVADGAHHGLQLGREHRPLPGRVATEQDGDRRLGGEKALVEVRGHGVQLGAHEVEGRRHESDLLRCHAVHPTPGGGPRS
jgi:hypothetical protein